MGTHRPPVVMPDTETQARVHRRKNRNDHDPGQTAASDPPGPRRPARGRDPSQMEFMESWMNAEIESRNAPNAHACSRPPDSPPTKELGGYDWTPIRFPSTTGAGRSRPSTSSPATTTSSCSGPPGTGKTHPRHRALAEERMPQGHTRTLLHRRRPLVMRLPQGPIRTTGSTGNSPRSAGPRCSSSTNSATCPSTRDGSRLLFQVVTNAYETQSIIYTTNIEFSGWGRIFGDPTLAAAIIDRTVHHGRMIRFEGESWRKDPRPHAITNAITNNQQDRPTPKRA